MSQRFSGRHARRLAGGACFAVAALAVTTPSALAKPHTGSASATPAARTTVRGPLLSASAVDSLPAGATAGKRYTLRGTAANTGTRAADGPVTVRLLRRGTKPRVIGTEAVSVAAHGTRRYAVEVAVPRGLRDGSYLVVACTKRSGATGVLGCATAKAPLAIGRATPIRGAKARAAVATPRAADTCSSGSHTLSEAGDHVYPEMGNGGYTSLHTNVNLVYSATTNTFLPGNNVLLTERADHCLTDFSLDFERTSVENASIGPDMTVGSVTVNGQPATFTFVQPTYPGDPKGQDDPDPNAHAAGLGSTVGDGNPLPPACTPPGDDPALNGQQCPATKLVVTPSAPIAAGASFDVQVNYTGRPGVHTDGDGSTEGWFRSDSPAGDGSFVTTEPVGTMAWMPLNNHPSAKPTYDFTEQVTAGRTAIANGELVGFSTNLPDANFAGGSTTWRWHSPEPIASYLVESSIGAYDLSERLATDGTLYYEAQGSSIAAGQKAANKAVMDQQEDITQFQARFNGDYPFSSAGVVIGIPGASFEEEMQTKITFNGGRISLGTFNHESMHQWWGDNVSESNYNETFFKEGMATIGEYYQAARTAATTAGGLDTAAGQAAFDVSLVNRFNSNYRNTSSYWTSAPSNPTAANLFGTPTYSRSGTAYLALRQVLGKDNFTSAMKQIQADYGGGSISEAQLIAEFHSWMPNQSQACSDRLDTFFTQWFDTAYPTGGGLNKPQLTGPGLNASPSGTTFYDAAGGCAQVVPTTTATFSGDPVDGRYQDPTVTLTAAEAGGPGVASTTYELDGGPTTAYTGPFVVTGDGTHTVRFSSTDSGGGVERTNTTTIENATAPVTTPSVFPVVAEGIVRAPATVTLSATDDSAGVASTEFQLDGGGWQAYTGGITIPTAGEHAVQYRSTDRLGAVEATKTLDLHVVASSTAAGPGTTAAPAPAPAGAAKDPLTTAAATAILRAKPKGVYVTRTLRTIRFSDRLPEAGRVTYALGIKVAKRTYGIGTSVRRVTAKGSIVVTIKLSARGRRLLAAHPRTKLTLRTIFVTAVAQDHITTVRKIAPKR